MAYIRSRIAKNAAREFLASKGLTASSVARATGIPEEHLCALIENSRLIPDMRIAGAFMRAFPEDDPTQWLVFDPERPDAPASAMIPNAPVPLPVVICGCGNLGHVFTGLLGARPDVSVRVLVSSPEKANRLTQALTGGIAVRLPDGRQVAGKPDVVTSDPAEAVPGARLILLCVPSHIEVDALNRVLPHIKGDNTIIGSIPAPGGFDWKARHALKQHGKSAVVFGMGYIPWMCKVADYGRAVRVLGGKPVNALVAIPGARAGEVTDLMGHLLQTPVLDLNQFLNMTLHTGNQVLHPGIMYDMFRAWDGAPLPEQPLFYEGVSESATAQVQRLSDEIQILKTALEAQIPGLNLPFVLPLHTSLLYGYGKFIQDPSTLRSAIATNRAYAGIRTPMLQRDGGWVPDWNSRFFWEDIPHGLVVLRDLADLLRVKVPAVDEILMWSQAKMNREYLVDGRLGGKDMAETGAPQCYGIQTPGDLVA